MKIVSFELNAYFSQLDFIEVIALKASSVE